MIASTFIGYLIEMIPYTHVFYCPVGSHYGVIVGGGQICPMGCHADNPWLGNN